MGLVLFGNRESGHSYKVALALAVLGLPYTYRPIDIDVDRTDRPQDFREASRFGEVPVLLEDGRPIVQSNAILLHLAHRTGRLDGGSQDRLREWMFWEANRIGFSLANLRYALRFTDNPAPAVVAWLQARTRADLDRLEEEFSQAAFLMGAEPSVADIACCGYLFFADQAGIDLAGWPRVNEWLGRIRGLPGWRHPYDFLS
jgi:glutathione S-transferase